MDGKKYRVVSNDVQSKISPVLDISRYVAGVPCD